MSSRIQCHSEINYRISDHKVKSSSLPFYTHIGSKYTIVGLFSILLNSLDVILNLFAICYAITFDCTAASIIRTDEISNWNFIRIIDIHFPYAAHVREFANGCILKLGKV